MIRLARARWGAGNQSGGGVMFEALGSRVRSRLIPAVCLRAALAQMAITVSGCYRCCDGAQK